MSSLGGPSIVTSGLVLHLDAANVKSFKGEPTVNLITNPIPTSTSNFVVQGGIGTSTYDSTINAVRWVRTSYETWGAFYHNSSLANYLFDTTATYSISFKWKYGPSHSATYSTYFNIIQDNGQNTIMGNYVLTTYSTLLSDGWYYFKTSGIPANPGITQTGLAPGFRIITGSQSGITDIYWKNLQFEKKTYSTPFVNGTRGTTVATSGGWIDRSGNSNSGQILNGPTYSSLKGGSISFNGTNSSYVTCPLSSTIQSINTNNALTISVFIKVASTSEYRDFVGVSKVSGNNPFVLRANIGNQYFFDWEVGGVRAQNTYPGTTSDILNKWVQLTATIGDGSVKIYSNGLQVGSTVAVSGSIKTIDSDFRVGMLGYNYFVGSISNTQLYNRALSATEVLQNYNATKSRFI